MLKSRPKTWWYRVAERLLPNRTREIPRPDRPDIVLLRQLEVVRGRVYLQQFAASEPEGEYHNHPWLGGTLAIGLSGRLTEQDPLYPSDPWSHGRHICWAAPYIRYMTPGHVHRTAYVGEGHTSIFVGLGLKTEHKYYWTDGWLRGKYILERSAHYKDHIQAFVSSDVDHHMTRDEYEHRTGR